MNEPRRLIQSGGIAQRLLDSASLDKPGPAARRHAASLAATASSFARTSSGGSGTYRAGGASGPSARPAKTLATWVAVGAAASVALGIAGSRLLTEGASHGAAPLEALPTLTQPAKSPDIAAEPATPLQPARELAPAPSATGNGPAEPAHIEPWVPSPVSSAPGTAPAPVAPRPTTAASLDETHQIEAARAALSRGDCPRAIAQLDAYDSSHPNGQLKPEAMALRIQALTNMGKTAEARALATEFEQKYPQHPLLGRVSGGVAR
jgi:hypothetical protein